MPNPYKVGEWYDCCCCEPETCEARLLICPAINSNSQPDVRVESAVEDIGEEWWCMCPKFEGGGSYDNDESEPIIGSVAGQYPYDQAGTQCGLGSPFPFGSILGWWQWYGYPCSWNDGGVTEYTDIHICVSCGQNTFDGGPDPPEQWVVYASTEIYIHGRDENQPCWGYTWYDLDHFSVVDKLDPFNDPEIADGVLVGNANVTLRHPGDDADICGLQLEFGTIEV